MFDIPEIAICTKFGTLEEANNGCLVIWFVLVVGEPGKAIRRRMPAQGLGGGRDI
jgi:hypothetical protein